MVHLLVLRSVRQVNCTPPPHRRDLGLARLEDAGRVVGVREHEVEVVGVVTVALLAKIDLNPPVGVDSMEDFTGEAGATVADLTGLPTLGDTNCMGFAALVGLGDRRRCRWSIFTGACFVGLGARTGGFSGLRGSFT